jgi:hypothetical protein
MCPARQSCYHLVQIGSGDGESRGFKHAVRLLQLMNMFGRPPLRPQISSRSELLRLPHSRTFDDLGKRGIWLDLVEEHIVLALSTGTKHGDHGLRWQLCRWS